MSKLEKKRKILFQRPTLLDNIGAFEQSQRRDIPSALVNQRNPYASETSLLIFYGILGYASAGTYDAYNMLANPFLRPANFAPYFCFHLRCLSPYLSRSITSRWLSGFHPRVPRSTLAILRSSRDHAAFLVPFQFHETKGPIDAQEKAFLESQLVSNYFSREGMRKATLRGFWTEGKYGKRARVFCLKFACLRYFRHKNPQKALAARIEK